MIWLMGDSKLIFGYVDFSSRFLSRSGLVLSQPHQLSAAASHNRMSDSQLQGKF